MEHVRLIDSLRGLAAGLVLVSHVAFWTGASHTDVVGGFLARGDAGVAIFFAISAFLLLSPTFALLLDPESTRATSWGAYTLRRAARILPAYWFAYAGVLVVGYLATTPDGVGSLKKILAHIFLTQGFTTNKYQSFSQTWSLTTEFSFYVLVPFISWLLTRATRHGAASVLSRVLSYIAFTALIGLLSQALAWFLMDSGTITLANALGTSALGHAAWFAVGAFVAVIVQAQRQGFLTVEVNGLARYGRWLLNQDRSTVLLAACAVFVLASTPVAGPRNLDFPTLTESLIKEFLYALFALLVLLAAIKPIPKGTSLDSYAQSGFNAWIGNTSYGVFLWHVLVLQLVFMTTGAELFNAGFGWTLQLVVTVTLAIASFSWFVVEKPILTFVRGRTTSARAQRD